MKRRGRKAFVVGALAAISLLAVATAVASARGGPARGASGSTLVTQAAKELSVTRAKLKDAIVASARDRIDDAVADGDVDRDDVADLKAEVEDNLQLAMSISRTRTVASNLGISTTKLNDGFRAARKALYRAQIDRALDDKRIDKDRADDLKDELDDADLPGYKAGPFGFGIGLAPEFGRGFGRGPGGGFPHR